MFEVHNRRRHRSGNFIVIFEHTLQYHLLLKRLSIAGLFMSRKLNY